MEIFDAIKSPITLDNLIGLKIEKVDKNIFSLTIGFENENKTIEIEIPKLQFEKDLKDPIVITQEERTSYRLGYPTVYHGKELKIVFNLLGSALAAYNKEICESGAYYAKYSFKDKENKKE